MAQSDMDKYPLVRCLDCGRIEQRAQVILDGMCQECAGTKYRPAFRIDDNTERRLIANGFVFEEKWFTSDPNYRPKGKPLPKIEEER